MSRVLIAEDSPTQAEHLRMVLQSEGFEVAVAPDGKKGLELFRSWRPDVVVTDVLMPGLSGYDLCRKIKEDPMGKDVPVILLTTLKDPMDIIEGLALGATNFITKPYEPDQLVARVRNVLANRSLRARAKLRVGVDLLIMGRQVTITSEKEQILDLLLSTFEEYVRTRAKEEAGRKELAAAHAKLEEYARLLEDKARLSEETHRVLMTSAGDGIVICDSQGVILEANLQAEALFGRSSEGGLQGKPMAELFGPKRDADADRYLKALRGPAGGRVEELALRRTDGSVVYVDCSVSSVQVGQGRLLLTILRDVTERKRAEERLAHLNRVLRAVRNVNQLITHEKDPDKLLQQACQLLTETRGYISVFILLHGRPAKFFYSSSSANADPYRGVAEKLLAGGSVPCVARALASPGAVVLEQPRGDCTACPMSSEYRGSKALAIKLEHGGRTFGVLSAALAEGTVPDAEEQSLFTEAGGDLAYALSAIEEEERRKESDAEVVRLASFPSENPHPILRVSLDTVLLYANEAAAPLLAAWGCKVGECLPEKLWTPLAGALKTGQARDTEEAYGERVWLLTWAPVVAAGYVNIYAREITDRVKAEEALRESEERYRMLFEDAQDGIALADAETGRLVDCNQALCRMVERTKTDLVGQSQAILHLPEENTEDLSRTFRQHQTSDPGQALEDRLLSKSGRLVPAEIRAVRIRMGKRDYLLGVFRNIAERKAGEEEKAKLESQLRQAQKMEAIGQLAGGVAHDFNNLLFVVNGRADLALRRLKPGDPLREQLEIIRGAGERAAALTRQLLAFSRRQVLQPRVLDLNGIVSNLEKMLHRLIREDIALTTVLEPALKPTKADPGQIEQVLMNLVVNARDAMPKAGKLVIGTANVELDETFCRLHDGARPGPYVALSVTDTGSGMDAAVKARLFEPFFTTKKQGEGTGLGLATVYGIVKQSGGYIEVESEVGKGTTFRIYLPQAEESAQPERAAPPVPETRRAKETILLAEDLDAVREVVRDLLEAQGYKVLAARHGAEALALAEKHKGPLHLLLTDVVMPEMSGPELAQRLCRLRPEMKILFMSGYTDAAIADEGALGSGANYVQKPVSAEELARKLRDLLGAQGHSQARSANA